MNRHVDVEMIDLIFTDETMQVSDIVHHAPLGKSDHSAISFKFHSYLDYTKPKERYSYEKADFQAMRNHLAETKREEEDLLLGCGRNNDELWNHLKLKIDDLRDQFVPKTTTSGKPSCNTNGSIPIAKPVQEAIRQKTPFIDAGCPPEIGLMERLHI